MNIYIIPDWRNLLLTLASVIILLFIVKKFAWAPMKEFLQKRQEIVTKEMDEAAGLKAEAMALKEHATSEIKEARAKAKGIVEASQSQALAVHDDIIETANQEAKRKVAKALAEIDLERKHVYANIREDIVNLAIDSAQNLIEKEINPQTHSQLFDEFVAKVGGGNE